MSAARSLNLLPRSADPESVTATDPSESTGNDVATLYREHFGFVWRSVRRLGVDPAAVDDLVQEVFIVVARRPGAFRGESSPRTWLFGIAMRVVGRHRRGAFRRNRKHAALAATPSDSQRANPYPQAEAAHTLLRLLDCLPQRHRAAYVLAELEGLTGPEVAEVLDVRPSTAYAWIDAARKRLLQKIQGEASQ